ncbi:uncharacterized protein LOC143230740 [Tachypleus tridentatus]|uniref:uncharacterized protein LOC143230740 n=1 Tax=Tachypleus tridentatus TaxID=6853 RepID=UPI003FD239F0
MRRQCLQGLTTLGIKLRLSRFQLRYKRFYLRFGKEGQSITIVSSRISREEHFESIYMYNTVLGLLHSIYQGGSEQFLNTSGGRLETSRFLYLAVKLVMHL